MVANLDLADAGPDSDHVADEFVADDGAALDALEVTGDDMKIRAANPRHGDTHERVRRVDEFGRRRHPAGRRTPGPSKTIARMAFIPIRARARRCSTQPWRARLSRRPSAAA